MKEFIQFLFSSAFYILFLMATFAGIVHWSNQAADKATFCMCVAILSYLIAHNNRVKE